MKKRILGSTGLEVSVVGFGGIPIQRVSEEESTAIIHACLESGINFIDSARGYTISEERIGRAIEGYRKEWILATKSGVRDYEGMKADIEISLKNLRTDYIDLYQCHFVRDREQYDLIMAEDGAYKALVEAKKAGKIGHIGITSHSADLLEEVIEDGKFETIQFPYNPVERQGERLFKRAEELNMGVIVMKPIAGGAIEKGETSIKYILNNSAVTTAIPGMDSVELVVKNSAVGKGSIDLTFDEIKEIENIQEDLGTSFCRRCGYCLPCPQGIDIPTQFIIEGYLTRYHLREWATERYASLEHKADECVQCGICEGKCPYDLPIMDMLKRVAKHFDDISE